MAEAVFDPRFEEVDVVVRYTPGTNGAAVDLGFASVPLEIADDLFRYLGTDEGLMSLVETILAAFVKDGVMSPGQAHAILLDSV